MGSIYFVVVNLNVNLSGRACNQLLHNSLHPLSSNGCPSHIYFIFMSSLALRARGWPPWEGEKLRVALLSNSPLSLELRTTGFQSGGFSFLEINLEKEQNVILVIIKNYKLQ